jgi:tetratricopeptide (TPR) repeat protein
MTDKTDKTDKTKKSKSTTKTTKTTKNKLAAADSLKDTSNVIPFPQLKAVPKPKAIPHLGPMDSSPTGVLGRAGLLAVIEAQDIIYDAWEATTSRRAVTLAKKALKIYPDCADAYVLLAQETAKTLQEETSLYRQGVEAGERALGKEFFKNEVGSFWGNIETRPYMRARAGLAECLWDGGRREDAVGHYQDMLRLNPGDNQGIRYTLMPRLITLGLDAKAEELFKNYPNDASAFWSYSRALMDFRKHGASPITLKSLKSAIKGNKYVPAYLLNVKKFPRTMPDHYGYGDINEAVIYVEDNMMAWDKTPGALEWLAKSVLK